jgi:hypothetical protein
MIKAMLAPAAVLALWSMLMLLWMVSTRFPALRQSGIDLKKSAPGGRGQDLEGRVPPAVMWKSHNYTHLMEQPTLFYAVVAILALAGPTAWDVRLAWAYTGLRVAHSLWQALVNKLPVRVAIFATSSLVLMALALHAVIITLIR